MNYYEHHIGDFLKKTAHLSVIKEGVYRRLLDRYYITEKPLPGTAKQCCEFARATSKPEREAVSEVLAEFFELREDGYHQNRADEEIARYKVKQSKAKASADARWGAQREASERNANASSEHDASDMRTHSERNANGMHRAPVPSPQSPDTKEKENPPAVRVPPTKGSRLPADWSPGDTGLAYASQKGLTNGKAQAELEKFRDWWAAQPGQKGVKADWQATWRTWVRTSVERSGGKPQGDSLFEGAR